MVDLRISTPEAGIFSPDQSQRPVLTPQDLPKGTATIPVLSTMETWTQYWREKFGDVGANLSITAFAILSSRDNNPHDELLDLASLRRDPNDDDKDDIQFVFNHVHPFDDKDQPLLDKMRDQLLERRHQLASLYAVRHNNQWVAVDEKGFPFAISGDAWHQAVTAISENYPDAHAIRLVGDARFFAGRETDSLNPDRNTSMAGFLFDPQQLILGGGVGSIDGGLLDLLPQHRLQTKAQKDSHISPESFEVWITVFQAALVILAAFAGKSGGGAPIIADFSGLKARTRALFDIEVPQDLVWAIEAAQATRGAEIPTVFMSATGEGRPRAWQTPKFEPARASGSGYAEQYRRENPSQPVVPRQTPEETSLPPPADPVPLSVSPPPAKEIHVALPAPAPKDLGAVEHVVRTLFSQCSVDAQGNVDTSALRNGPYLTVVVRFSDGTTMTTEALLRAHERAWAHHHEVKGKSAPALPGTFRSEKRLVDVFRRTLKRPDLHARGESAVTMLDLKVDVPRVRISGYSKALSDALRATWQAFEAGHRAMDVEAVTDTMVQAKNGERERLFVLMSRYWEGLEKEFARSGVKLPKGDRYYRTADGLDIIHYKLFDRPRVRTSWGKNVSPVALPMTESEPLLDASTLPGALSILYKFNTTLLMHGAEQFPNPPHGTTVVLYDVRTGRLFNYVTLMRDIHYKLALEKADPEKAAVLKGVVVDEDLIQDPKAARASLPRENTRISLLDFVRKFGGYPQASVSSIVRRRGGTVSAPVLELKPAIPPPPTVPPTKQTLPYAASGRPATTTTDISRDVAVARMIMRMTNSDFLSDARSACTDMVVKGTPEATQVLAWIDTVTRGSDVHLEQALEKLPLRDQLQSVLLPLILNDVALRALSVTKNSGRSRKKWSELWSSGMLGLSPFERYDRIQKFVVEEEARIDARPRGTDSRRLRDTARFEKSPLLADTQTDLSLSVPAWYGFEAPETFARAMGPLIADPTIRMRATDITRAFMAFMPLDDLPIVQVGKKTTDTSEVMYGQMTGRASTLDSPTMSPAELSLHQAMKAIGEARGMIQFNDFWLGRGVKWARRDHTIPPTLRFYLAVNPVHAERVLVEINNLYDKWNPDRTKDIQTKITNVPPELVRTDSALVYTDAANQGIWRDLVALRAAHPDYFRAVNGPVGTANFRDANGNPIGISIAEAPPRVDESRNGVWSMLNTQGLRDYRGFVAQGTPFTAAELMQATAFYLDKGGIDLVRPAFYKATPKREAGWKIFEEVFRQTDQYDPKRDTPIDGQ